MLFFLQSVNCNISLQVCLIAAGKKFLSAKLQPNKRPFESSNSAEMRMTAAAEEEEEEEDTLPALPPHCGAEVWRTLARGKRLCDVIRDPGHL